MDTLSKRTALPKETPSWDAEFGLASPPIFSLSSRPITALCCASKIRLEAFLLPIVGRERSELGAHLLKWPSMIGGKYKSQSKPMTSAMKPSSVTPWSRSRLRDDSATANQSAPPPSSFVQSKLSSKSDQIEHGPAAQDSGESHMELSTELKKVWWHVCPLDAEQAAKFSPADTTRASLYSLVYTVDNTSAKRISRVKTQKHPCDGHFMFDHDKFQLPKVTIFIIDKSLQDT